MSALDKNKWCPECGHSIDLHYCRGVHEDNSLCTCRYPRTENAKLRELLKKVLNSADSDWWAERADLDRMSEYDVTLTAGILWDIDEALKEQK